MFRSSFIFFSIKIIKKESNCNFRNVVHVFFNEFLLQCCPVLNAMDKAKPVDSMLSEQGEETLDHGMEKNFSFSS